MSYEEFAFFNQQLAAMLRDGIPLEGALRQLCLGMRAGTLKLEIQNLERDLAQGSPLRDALGKRELPEFYRRMVEIGARSQDLPGVLILLADYYQRINSLGTRLKGLMVYPLIVILVSLGLSLVLSLLFGHFLSTFFDQFQVPTFFMICMWIPPVVLLVLATIVVGAVSWPAWRRRLRWRVPAFREASLANLASAMALMLKNGTPLAEALAMAGQMEAQTPAAPALAQWRRQVESGQGKAGHWTSEKGVFPPLVMWMVQKGGEDLTAGFEKAAELYRSRAGYRIELALYGALPVSILFLGQMILWQVMPLLRAIGQLMNMLGDAGGSS
jgi:type II secretory pathway component PulF